MQDIDLTIPEEPFDYTEWQRDLFAGMSLEELGQKAMESRINKS